LLIGGLAFVGLQAAGAATYVLHHEAEAGTIAGSATAATLTGASSGTGVVFGAQPGNGSSCQPLPKSGGGTWTCTWADEFNGTALNRNMWSVIPYGLGNACQSDDANHVQVSGGNLRLLATRNAPTDFCRTQWGLEYTGGFIQTLGNFAQQYGRFEMRAKLPSQDGAWPAFWLLPGDDSYDGEIDILESYGGRSEQGGDVGDFTLHAPAAGPGPQRTCRIYPNYSDAFHTYTFEWTATSMRVLFDNVECATFTGMSEPAGTSPPAFPATFSKPYHILLNLAVQPWWPPTASTQFPMVMEVDYVRVWQ
jgi:beta-glucanase (GH16 family)